MPAEKRAVFSTRLAGSEAQAQPHCLIAHSSMRTRAWLIRAMTATERQRKGNGKATERQRKGNGLGAIL
eukprot:3146520-Rhodomonas_salina.1